MPTSQSFFLDYGSHCGDPLKLCSKSQDSKNINMTFSSSDDKAVVPASYFCIYDFPENNDKDWLDTVVSNSSEQEVVLKANIKIHPSTGKSYYGFSYYNADGIKQDDNYYGLGHIQKDTKDFTVGFVNIQTTTVGQAKQNFKINLKRETTAMQYDKWWSYRGQYYLYGTVFVALAVLGIMYRQGCLNKRLPESMRYHKGTKKQARKDTFEAV